MWHCLNWKKKKSGVRTVFYMYNVATKLLVVTCDQLKKNEKSLKYVAKKSRLNIRNTVCLLVASKKR